MTFRHLPGPTERLLWTETEKRGIELPREDTKDHKSKTIRQWQWEGASLFLPVRSSAAAFYQGILILEASGYPSAGPLSRPVWSPSRRCWNRRALDRGNAP